GPLTTANSSAELCNKTVCVDLLGGVAVVVWCSDFQVIAEVATFKLPKLRTLGHETGGGHSTK
ncbi:hypothetical protein L917_05755, partial [Phytophthora nicotianae]